MTTEKTKREEILNRLTAPLNKNYHPDRGSKYKTLAPHENLHNFHTIRWLRSRFNHKVFNRSINTLLPNNGAPKVDSEPQTKNEKAKEFLSTYCQPPDKFHNFDISPKYLYSTQTMEKIQKLKQIFIEFDEDGSRKLEIGEMVEMFQTNKIPVEQDQLVKLFFNDKRPKRDEDLYLDFYQFMLFALSNTSDQDFRIFMRELKKRKAEELKKGKKRITLNNNKNDEEETLFLPMNFNLVLDYFNNKGKQRDSQDVIVRAIKTMNKIIDSNSSYKNKESKKDKEKEKDEIKTIESDDSASHDDNADDEDKREERVNEQASLEEHNKINIVELFEEFRKLFVQTHVSDKSHNPNRMARKVLGLKSDMDESDMDHSRRATLKLDPKLETEGEKNVNISSQISEIQKNLNDFSKYEENQVEMKITEYLIERNKDNMAKTSLSLYNKYRSLNLAIEDTKKIFANKNTESARSTHYSNFKSTGYQSRYNTSVSKNYSDEKKGYFGKSHNGERTCSNFFSNKNNANNLPKSSKISSHSPNKQSVLIFPEIISKKNMKATNDYIPLKLIRELNPGSSRGNGSISYSRNSDQSVRK
jgi:hypothetical protein